MNGLPLLQIYTHILLFILVGTTPNIMGGRG